MTAEIKATQVDLSGLLDVLGKNLYSTPLVAIRELIQNAHDACYRRKIEGSDCPSPEIRLRTPGNNRLVIEDNGAGLTKSEISDYLATIGSGYTRLLRDRTDTEDMIGYFGLGFLSAYVISDQVEINTTSYQTPDQGWHFTSNGGMNYAIQAAPASAIGSQVTLHLSSDFEALANSSVLSDVVAKYCCLLNIPIYINDHTHAVNTLDIPWKLPEDVSPTQHKKRRFAFAEIFEKHFEPLATMLIEPSATCDVSGMLWVQGGSSYATSDHRNATIFVRDMYITDEARDILPTWAGFVGCVLDTPILTPTASREEIQKDAAYQLTKQHIEDTLISRLKSLSKQEPEAWQRILSRHNEILLGAAVSDDSLFEVLHNDLRVPTTEGDMTLSEVVQNSENKINVSIDESNSYDEVLCRAMKVPIVMGYRFAAYPFCQRYADMHPVNLIVLGTKAGNDTLFGKADADADTWEKLNDLFTEAHESLTLTAFKPDFLPMIMIPDEEAILKRKIESDSTRKRISTAALGLATLYTKNLQDDIRVKLYLNMNSPLIEALLTLPTDRQTLVAGLMKTFAASLGRTSQHATNRSLADELAEYHKNLLALLQ